MKTSIVNTSSGKGEIWCLPSLAMQGFCLAWACVGLVLTVTIIVSSVMPRMESTVSLMFTTSGFHTFSASSSAMIYEPRKEKLPYRDRISIHSLIPYIMASCEFLCLSLHTVNRTIFENS